MPSFYSYLELFESLFQSRSKMLVIKVAINGIAQINECKFPVVLSHASSKSSSKINISDSFKTLPALDSILFFLWFDA